MTFEPNYCKISALSGGLSVCECIMGKQCIGFYNPVGTI